MIVFGVQSSLFDFVTFALLYGYFHASVQTFRTGWFMESLLSQILILQVLRTRHIFFKSRPSKYLLSASLFTFVACLIIPYLPISDDLELFPLPANILGAIVVVVLVYMVVAEITKRLVMKKW
jgi:Mg2+-importing ATPase